MKAQLIIFTGLLIMIYLLRTTFVIKNNEPKTIQKVELINKLTKKKDVRWVRKVKKKYSIKVTVTVYNAVEAQCNKDFQHTASMFKLDLKNPYKHRIIAVSRDLLKKFPMGTKVLVTGTNSKYDGEWTVEDKLNKRYKKSIDLLVNLDMGLGKWYNVKLTKIK